VQYSLLLSVYTLPNIVLCFLAGPIVDRFGHREANLTILVLLFLGHGVFTLSPIFGSFKMAVLGRLLVGYNLAYRYCCRVFMELHSVTFIYILSLWFKNREQGLATS
jgi:MFS family permease